jgi:hypothetical protein
MAYHQHVPANGPLALGGAVGVVGAGFFLVTFLAVPIVIAGLLDAPSFLAPDA